MTGPSTPCFVGWSKNSAGPAMQTHAMTRVDDFAVEQTFEVDLSAKRRAQEKANAHGQFHVLALGFVRMRRGDVAFLGSEIRCVQGGQGFNRLPLTALHCLQFDELLVGCLCTDSDDAFNRKGQFCVGLDAETKTGVSPFAQKMDGMARQRSVTKLQRLFCCSRVKRRLGIALLRKALNLQRHTQMIIQHLQPRPLWPVEDIG